MFGKLKEKLKASLNLFSKQVEEEVDDGITEEAVEEVQAEAVEVPKAETVEVPKAEAVEVPKAEAVEEVPQVEAVEVPKTETVEEVPQVETVEVPKAETVEEVQAESVEENVEVPQVETVEEPQTEAVEVPKAETVEVPKAETVEAPRKGFFSRIKDSISTKTLSQQKFEDIFWELEVVLLENNVSVKVIDKIKQDLQTVLVDQKLPRNPTQIITDTLRKSVDEILDFEHASLLEHMTKKPYVIMFFGINGAGKTTTIAKIIKYLQNNDKSVVVAAADTFRAAAIDQIEEHTTKLGVKLIKHDYGSDPAAVAFDAVRHAEKNEIDVVLIDTAGRLHSNTNLMSELDKIIRVANPDLSLFVGESITGNDCVEQAEQFNQVTNLDGVILSKADIDEMGGATLSISYTLKKPIYFLGVGQEYTDLMPFNKSYIIDKLGL